MGHARRQQRDRLNDSPCMSSLPATRSKHQFCDQNNTIAGNSSDEARPLGLSANVMVMVRHVRQGTRYEQFSVAVEAHFGFGCRTDRRSTVGEAATLGKLPAVVVEFCATMDAVLIRAR